MYLLNLGVKGLTLYWDLPAPCSQEKHSAVPASWPIYLGIELWEEIKVSLEVCGKDGFDGKEPEPFELCRLQPAEEVVLGVGHEQRERRRCVVVLQHGPIVVE